MVQMTKRNKVVNFALLASVLVFITSLAYIRVPEKTSILAQSQVMPGELSAAHALFKSDCSACHTAAKGIDEAKCVSCHADNKDLLARQPTAFHATIGNCASCHVEHQGEEANLRVMDHEALARIGAKLISGRKNIVNQPKNPLLPMGHPLVSPLVATLDCATCHSTKDRHATLFGQNCATCHATTEWTIPEFQHPSMRSIECAQCHQAPPSHFMEHFEMVSKKVAKQENAVVTQCYSCHQTTSWNDIKGLGLYDHH
ncbi:hypothetical protein C1N53_22665 (plasmid) [Pontibacter sp. SGAir0037]|uniref:Uncharacterized protein n=2 Tax=Hymenobacteraceae TaxID=1853232 RepID=A0A1X9YYH8_9BACT|nr:hypothetical protein CA264_20760 [Pontibacter actiniarum]QCR25322.1 hypothetical protein C1N53_22665 [Pontibacter sp. SGAir0037]